MLDIDGIDLDYYGRKIDRNYLPVARAHGLKVDLLTRQRWTGLVGLARIVDNHMDQCAHQEAGQSVTEARDLLSEEDVLARFIPGLDTTELAFFNRFVARIVDMNDALRYVESPSDYISIRVRDGRNYGAIIAGVASQDVRVQPSFDMFMGHMAAAGSVVNLLNSMHGVAGDYRRGEISLAPSAGLYMQMSIELGRQLCRVANVKSPNEYSDLATVMPQ